MTAPTWTTISKYIYHSVTLGASGVKDNLSITSAGNIDPNANGVTGVYVPDGLANPTIINSGYIFGGLGVGTSSYSGGVGIEVGAGASTAVIINYYAISGGGGAYNSNPSNGGTGGTGILLQAGTILNNNSPLGLGTITGGYGGNNISGAGGAGGVGTTIDAGAYLRNSAYVYGGRGGVGTTNGGDGGTGVVIANGSVVNGSYGTISGGNAGASAAGYAGSNGGAGAQLDGGTLITSGYVFGGLGQGNGGTGGTGLILSGGLVVNSGSIVGGNGLSGTTLGGNGGNGVYLDGGTLITSGYINGGMAGTGTIDGEAGAAILFGNLAGTLVVDPGAVFTGAVTAQTGVADVLELAGTSASYLDGIGTQFTNFTDIDFATGSVWTLSGDAEGLASGETINGFGPDDTIDLTGFAAISESFITGTGLVLSNGTTSVTLDLTSSLSNGNFIFHSDLAGGTDVVTCFAAGTSIATARGDVAVEDLEIGDRVKTLHAGLQKIKFIGYRSYAAPFANHAKILPVCIRAGALADNVPARDLYVSPGHAICIDGVLVQAARLVNGVNITQSEHVDTITYFHLEFENHEIIFAENCPAETFMGEEFRNLFHNAAEFFALYPGQAAPSRACLPLVESGFLLKAMQRRIAARAGIVTPAHRPMGPLRGYVDGIAAGRISGWAQDLAAPEEPVCLEILCRGRFIAHVMANAYRADLQAAGIGSGCHGFTLQLSKDLAGPFEVRRAAGGCPLVMTETGLAHVA